MTTGLQSKSLKMISKLQFHGWIAETAKHIGVRRKFAEYEQHIFDLPSSTEEQNLDWEQGEARCVTGIIIENAAGIRLLDEQTYPFLQNVWLKDVKRTLAYLEYAKDRERSYYSSEKQKDDHYYCACKFLNSMIFDASCKLPKGDFKKIQDYIEKHYLRNGSFDENLINANLLLHKKAARICDIQNENGKSRDDLQNWYCAKTYVSDYYSHIVPAVTKKDYDATVRVLEAFKLSKNPDHKLSVISAFETAIAIYFLDPDAVQEYSRKIDQSVI